MSLWAVKSNIVQWLSWSVGTYKNLESSLTFAVSPRTPGNFFPSNFTN